jgi:hypothetical protein
MTPVSVHHPSPHALPPRQKYRCASARSRRAVVLTGKIEEPLERYKSVASRAPITLKATHAALELRER